MSSSTIISFPNIYILVYKVGIKLDHLMQV
ncbi:hypothetical protein ACJIZ3_007777 [Penstemon smallii]|uniref:Uncharacterized protein n=1 Tax=Penstemon smallii TaxID=265156 RepID=A0ABD3T8W6_9LAMI